VALTAGGKVHLGAVHADEQPAFVSVLIVIYLRLRRPNAEADR